MILLQKSASSYVYSQINTKKHKDSLMQICSEIDTEGAGCLSYEEMQEVYTKYYGNEQRGFIDLNFNIENSHIDAKELIDYTSFLRVSANRILLIFKTNLKETFDLFINVMH